jgi:hypothetical protein
MDYQYHCTFYIEEIRLSRPDWVSPAQMTETVSLSHAIPADFPNVLLIDLPSAIHPWLVQFKLFDADKIQLKIPHTSPLTHSRCTLS